MAPKRARDSEHASKQPHGKRRKGAPEDAPAEVDPAAQKASVEAYMFHAVKLLHKALKKSRTFETQKLARKVKQTKEPKEGEPVADATVVADLEAQLTALKALSIDHIPPYILSTRLPKLPFLRSVDFLDALLKSLSTFPAPSKAELDPTTTKGKARNRTLANKNVKEAWDEVSRAVAKRMGEEVEERKEKEKVAPTKPTTTATKPSAVVNAPAAVAEGGDDEEGAPKPEKRLSKRAERAAKGAAKALLPKPAIKMDPSRMAALAAASDSEAGDESEDEGPLSGSEMGDDDDEVARELARLGGGSDAEGAWSGSEQGAQSDADDSGDEGFASDSSFPTVKSAPSKPEKARKMKQASSSKPITSSAFLPTLAGGYISYSDSDGEDAKWVKDAEKGDKKERKNRRGQRARQAIWEKKYGSGANHVVKTTGGVPAAPKGGKAGKKAKKEVVEVAPAPFNPLNAPGGSTNVNAQPLGQRKVVRPTITYKSKAPAVPVVAAKIAEFASSAPAAVAGPVRGSGGPPGRGGRTPLPPPPKIVPSRVEEGMHPSWEAKRRAQEALANLANAPKGKKITFD